MIVIKSYRKLSSDAKICKFGVPFSVEKDVSCLDVSVDLSHKVKILETL